MTEPKTEPTAAQEKTRFRRTLVKVMTMQIATLALLWWMQSYFSH